MSAKKERGEQGNYFVCFSGVDVNNKNPRLDGVVSSYGELYDRSEGGGIKSSPLFLK